MNDTIWTDIPFHLDLAGLLQKLRIDGRPEYAERCACLARQGAALARPKAAYRLAGIEHRGPDSVVVDGVTLTSRVLRVNLENVHRVFPFVVTCGAELENWSKSIDDMLERFWADALMEEALRTALDALKADLVRRYGLDRTGMMNPGSLADWPIEQQADLFRILGGMSEPVGVRLTDSFLMVPVKSVSGLCFPTETRYENCQLCPRPSCPNRRAPYDPDLYERRYAGSTPGRG